MPKYVALLRGINVGGNKKVPMKDLSAALAKAGYTEVKTLLNSGNVVFQAPKQGAAMLEKALSALIEKRFGFPVPVLVREMAALEALHGNNPFKGIPVTEKTRLYVTFLADAPRSSLKLPYVSPDKEFRILSLVGRELISVLTVSDDRGSVDAMAIVEKEFGKNVTTRNWNTIEKLLAL